MVRVALLITNFEGGGAQKISLTLAENLKSYNITMDIITMEDLSSYELPDTVNFISLTHSSGEDPKLKKAFAFPQQVKALADLVRREEYPVVVSFLERADFVNILAKKYFSKHTAISTIHSHLTATYQTEGASLRVQAYTQMVKTLEPQADHIVAVSQGIADDGIKNYHFNPEKTSVIYNPFDVPGIREKATLEVPEEHQKIFNGQTVVTIGRMSRQKGQWHTLRAFKKVKSNHPDAKLLILGDGDLRNELVSLSTNLGLATYTIWDEEQPLDQDYDVYFLGFVQNPFMYLAKANAFILSSHFEGLPNVMVEALICGTPIIATDCHSGPRELLAPDTALTDNATKLERHTYGYLVPVGREIENFEVLDPTRDEIELAIGINEVLANISIQEELRAKAPERLEPFTLEHSLESWAKLLRQFVKNT